jgi:hypothetical protein
MLTTTPIQYLRRTAIDTAKWDACIAAAPNGLIYAYVHYLDALCQQWDALVMGDYEQVMPLPFKQKMGIAYIYQPPFTAALGVFGKHITPESVNAFIAAIPDTFKLVEYPLNRGNYFPGLAHCQDRVNYVLSLQSDYETLYKGYRENNRRNIKKALQLGCRAEKNIPLADVLALAIPQLKSLSNLQAKDYANFTRLYDTLATNNEACTYGVYDPQGAPTASCVFFFSPGRAYYILVGNHPNGKTIGASHALIDAFIKDHAGRDMVLDFEGSDIRNLAFFYSGFGAQEELYPALVIHRLPWWAKLANSLIRKS